jgi:anti-sigma B factor antagonist
MPFGVERRDSEGAVVIAVRGELDIGTAPELRAALAEAIEAHPGARLIADLEGLDFIDSAGLGILVGGRKRAQSRDGDVVLVSTGLNIGRTLELTGLDRVFEIYSSVTAAASA